MTETETTKTKPTLRSLAQKIGETSNAIADYLEKHNLPAPTFAEDGPAEYPRDAEIQPARFELLTALTDLQHLAAGPCVYAAMGPVFNNQDSLVLDTLNQFGFFAAVPVGGSATYGEISQATTPTLPEAVVRRILRYAFTMRLFAEAPLPAVDRVVHTATTAFLAKSAPVRSFIGHNLEEIRPGAVHTPEALRRYSAGREQPGQEANDCGFSVADITGSGQRVAYFDYIKADAAKAKRFAEGMQAAAAASGAGQTDTLAGHYDWASLGPATVVDVGGSAGHDSAVLAAAFPNLRLVVQDLPNVEAAFRATVPAELQQAGRVRFEGHDFLQPQALAADVYVLKWVLHDWPDKYAIQILRQLLPHLQASGDRRILLCEVVLPPIRDAANGRASLPPFVERLTIATDLQMLVACNSQERTLEHWQALARQVDEHLEARLVAMIPGTLWGLLELTLQT